MQEKISTKNDLTNFGFKQIKTSEKTSMVKNVFNSVAEKYDLMNDIMSLGIHHLWKNKVINILRPQNNQPYLDVAGGTGDIAFKILKQAPKANATICDINHNMMLAGRDKAINNNVLHNINWICGNAETLPFPTHHFQGYTIAFGIRNVTNIEKALSEAYRVLKPSGKFICLEFATPPTEIIRRLYDLYSFNLIPHIGGIITGDKDSYQYLVESIRKFPKQEQFKNMLTQAGFQKVKYTNLTGGIVAIHSGYKI